MPYTCSICGMWVMDGVTHYCGGTPQQPQFPIPSGIPLSLPVQQVCRAPYNPISAAEIRLIIREEIERYFASQAKPAGVE